eukprot:scaffold129512_cov54-Phaeocystis_antarctica.AAC.1
MTTLWAAVTFIFLEMPLNATAVTISVAAAAFGGPHAEVWPALPLHLQVTNPFASAWSTQGTAELLAQQLVLSGAVVFGACVCGRVTTRLVQTCAVTLREHVGTTRSAWSPNITISAPGHASTKQDDLWAKQLVE